VGRATRASFTVTSGATETHQSKTDSDARRYRKGKGQEAKLGYLGHVLMENRHGLIVDALATQADGTAEREAAIIMLYRNWRKHRRAGRKGALSMGADKAYDTRHFVGLMRQMQIRPHVAQSINRSGGSSIDGRTTRHASYDISQRKRPIIESLRLDEADGRPA
jgi:hypothetical protein